MTYLISLASKGCGLYYVQNMAAIVKTTILDHNKRVPCDFGLTLFFHTGGLPFRFATVPNTCRSSG